MRSARARLRGLSAVLAIVAGVATPAFAAETAPARVPPALGGDARTWVRFHADAPERLRRQWEREGYEVTGVDPERGTVDVRAPKEAVALFAERNADRIRAAEPLGLERRTQSLQSYKRPWQVRSFLSRVEQEYPLVTTVEDLTPYGLFEGQHILAARLTSNAGALSDKPAVLFTCQIHAGEVMTTEVCLDIVEVLSRGYGVDPAVTNWLDRTQVWVVPMVNPDGIDYAIVNDVHWRMNRRPTCPVDLNRNFERTWDSCDGAAQECGGGDDYRGPASASEPETQTLSALLARLRPRFHIDYHSYGEKLAYPGGCGPLEGMQETERHAKAMAAVLQGDGGAAGSYRVGVLKEILYPVSGCLMDESHAAYGATSFLFEINREFVPDYALREPTVVRQRAAWQYLLEQASIPRVEGRVRDAVTGAPVQARLRLVPDPFTEGEPTDSTDVDGQFSLFPLERGAGRLVFLAAGYRHALAEFQVDREPVFLDVALTPGQDANRPPVAVAGPAQAVVEGAAFAVDGSGSLDLDGDLLSYRWSASGADPLPLGSLAEPTASFVAPRVSEDTSVGIELEVTDGLAASRALVNVEVIQKFGDPRSDAVRLCSVDTPKQLAAAGTSSTLRPPMGFWVREVSVSFRTHLVDGPRGDLFVELASPGRKAARGYAGFPGCGGDLVFKEFIGEPSGGDWTLSLRPNAGSTYVLDAWTLAPQLEGAGFAMPLEYCPALDDLGVSDSCDGTLDAPFDRAAGGGLSCATAAGSAGAPLAGLLLMLAAGAVRRRGCRAGLR